VTSTYTDITMKIHIIYTVEFLRYLRAGVQPTLGPARRPWESSNTLAQERGGELVGVCASGVCAWRAGNEG